MRNRGTVSNNVRLSPLQDLYKILIYRRIFMAVAEANSFLSLELRTKKKRFSKLEEH